MKFSSIALTLLLSSNANAFVPNFGQKGLFKTNLSSTAVTKEAHFEAVKKNLQDKLQAQEAIPEALKPSLDYFVNEYMTACLNAAEDGDEEVTAEMAAKNVMSAVEFGNKYGLSEDKFMFETAHTAIREPFDYYRWGCNFFYPVMNGNKSAIKGEESLNEIEKKLEAGENVVFFANHQSEADPQVVSYAFEQMNHGKLAEDMIYVAGHKVTTDPLAIPFSMGRNLLCIHSKKHLDSDPETKPMKSKQNLATMSHMQNLLKEGGALIWVAPSGGRDRRDLKTNEVPIAPFDQKTIDLFRLLGVKSKKTCNFYTMALVSYDLCPPPDFVTKDVGEQRNIRYSSIGVSIAENPVENVGGAEKRHLFTERAFAECDQLYNELLEEMS